MVDTLIEARSITKTFPGVVALNEANFTCNRGEIHAVVGENGAGKSTLMKILAGVYQPDHGEVIFKGQPVRLTSPHHAQELGISIIYQELNLLPDLNVAENVFLGREPRHALGIVDSQELEKRASEVLQRLGVSINPRTRLRQLSVAEQQMVEIAKALSLNAELVIMDEPSATLGVQDLENVFKVIQALKEQNVGVIYISHRIAEVFQIADRVTVFKDGQVVGTHPIGEIDRADLIRMMIGRTLSETFPPRSERIDEEVLSIRGVQSGSSLHDINLTIHRGEIVGIAGLMGAGGSTLAEVIFGVHPIDAGNILLSGKVVTFRGPRDALRHRIGFLTEDRKEGGLVLGMSVRHNAALPSLKDRQTWGIIQARREDQVISQMITNLACRTPSLNQEVQFLSGGNQQKVVLAKWLISEPDLLIFDEPTRGIDVGAKSEIWQLMRDLANQGKGILMISSELPEVMGMSDRIVVMHRGRIAGILSGEQATEEEVMMLASYGERHG